jgi:hypothetical protein
MKSVFVLFNTDMFTDEGSSPPTVAKFPLQDKNDLKILDFKLEVRCQQSAFNIRLKHKSLISRSNLHRVKMRPFPKAALSDSRRQKRRLGVILTDTRIKIALETDAESHAKLTDYSVTAYIRNENLNN